MKTIQDCTWIISDIAHASDIPVEAELGAVMGHEEGPLLPYNVGTAIRQPYERELSNSVKAAQDAVYRSTVRVIEEDLELSNSALIINP